MDKDVIGDICSVAKARGWGINEGTFKYYNIDTLMVARGGIEVYKREYEIRTTDTYDNSFSHIYPVLEIIDKQLLEVMRWLVPKTKDYFFNFYSSKTVYGDLESNTPLARLYYPPENP